VQDQFFTQSISLSNIQLHRNLVPVPALGRVELCQLPNIGQKALLKVEGPMVFAIQGFGLRRTDLQL
jgi:hypothetical protein